jgi:predicted MFS family arabinose efflux permease
MQCCQTRLWRNSTAFDSPACLTAPDHCRLIANSVADPTISGDRARQPESFSRGYRAWMLGLLMLVSLLNLADRQGLAAVAPAIKLDLRLSDSQLGLILGLGFAIFYTLLGLPIARLSEHFSRARIFAAASAVFALFLLLSSWARGFVQILLCRVGVGAGDAGFGPPVASLLGDHYPERKRASAMTIVWLGAPLGALTGAMLGGWIAQNASWRLWFVALSVPSMLVALLAYFTLKEPQRGLHDPVAPAGPPPSMWRVATFMWAKRSMLQVLIGASLASIAMNGIGQFLGRYYTAVFHLGLFESGRLLGSIAVAGMASGLSLGGFGVSYLSARDRRWYVWAPAIGLAATTPLFLLALTRATLSHTIWLLVAGHVTLFVYFTPTLALAQNMVGASMRASSSFVINIVFGLIGVGLGPTLIGRLSDLLAHRAFGSGDFILQCPGGAAAAAAPSSLAAACAAASASGIRQAIGVFSLLFAWAALHFLLAARHLDQDLDHHYVAQVAARRTRV